MGTNLHLKHLLGREMPRNGVYGGGGRYNASTCHGHEEVALLIAAVHAGLSAIQEAGELRNAAGQPLP